MGPAENNYLNTVKQKWESSPLLPDLLRHIYFVLFLNFPTHCYFSKWFDLRSNKAYSQKGRKRQVPFPDTLRNYPFGSEALANVSPGEYIDMVCNLPLQSDSHLWEMKKEKPLNILIWKLTGQGSWQPRW